MKAIALASAALAATFVLGLVIVAGGATGPATLTALVSDAGCQGTGTLVTLTPAQSFNAETIVSVVAAASGESAQAEQIALMVALTESGLHNDSARSGNDGSLVLFQQRTAAGWGTAAEEQNPADAAGLFVQHLLQVPGWQTMRPWTAAQAVQGSAFSNGSNYESNWSEPGDGPRQRDQLHDGGRLWSRPGRRSGRPRQLFRAPGRIHDPLICDRPRTAGRDVRTQQARFALRVGGCRADVVRLFGAHDDGLGAGRGHPGPLQVSQMHEGLATSPAAIAPGDLVLIPGSDSPGPGLPGHVGIYLGDGLVESAVDPAVGTVVQSWTAFVSGGLDAVVDPVG